MVLTCRKRLGLAPHSQRSINDETLIMDSSKGWNPNNGFFTKGEDGGVSDKKLNKGMQGNLLKHALCHILLGALFLLNYEFEL